MLSISTMHRSSDVYTPSALFLAYPGIWTSQIYEFQVVKIMGDGVVYHIAGYAMFHNLHFVIGGETMLLFITQSVILDRTQVR